MKLSVSLFFIVIVFAFVGSNLVLAALPQGMVFLMTFDEKSGNTVKDMSGNNNNGTVVGKAGWVAGKYGNGFNFDGATNITVANAKPLSALTDPMSVGVWVKPEALDGWRNIVEMDGNAGWKLGFNVSNVVFTTYHVQDFTAGGKAINIAEWTHITATWDGKQVIVYINGEPEPPIAGGGKIDVAKEPSLDIGFRSTSKSAYIKGTMDDLFIITKVLKQDEVKTMMKGFADSLTAVTPSTKLTTTWGEVKN